MNAPPNSPLVVPSSKAPRQPMLWAAVSYSAGIITGIYVWRPPLLWVLAGSCFTFSAAYFAFRRTRFSWGLALAALFVMGALQIQVRSGDTPLDTSILPYADGQELQITGHVIRDGRLQPGGLGEVRETVELQAEEIRTDSGQTIPVRSGIRLGIYAPSGTAMTAFSYGNAFGFRPSFGVRETFATLAASTMRATLPTAGSRRWAQPS